MRNVRAAAGALMILAAAACTAPQPQPPAFDQQAIEAEVNGWLGAFWETWAEGGAGFDRGIAMYDDHPDFALAYDGSLWRSLPSADTAFRPAFQNMTHQDIAIPQTAIAVLGPDLVHVAQQVTTIQTLADGSTVGPIHGVVTMVLVRVDGAWKIRFYHESTAPSEKAATP